MQLSSLTRHDEKTAKAILAAAALAHDSTPYYSEYADRYKSEVRELMAEAESVLHIAPGSDQYDEVMRSFLSKQVETAIMGDSDPAEVRRRLGRQGRLPLSGYEIDFSKSFVKESRENEKYIRRAIASATDFQHVFASSLPDVGKGMTLIMIPQMLRKVEHWLLVDAIRENDKLLVDRSFRVFPSIVDLRTANAPLEVLRAFVDHYGLSFSLENMPPAKMYEQLLFAKSEGQLDIKLPDAGTEYDVTVTGSSFTFKEDVANRLGVPMVGCTVIAAYGVDVAKYRRDRAKLIG